ncbi:MAG: DNA polymerase III subunit epsilon [Eggerthellaceae bacterium]|nr:DNA polymerase III subunit epsilon [Eggerthellaceae bacterium]
MAHSLETYIYVTAPQRVKERYLALADYAKTADFGALDADVVVIDTETTGVSFNNDELTQIAAARLVKGEIKEWFVTFVNPVKPIPEEIAHLTNITDADVADAPMPQEALAQLSEFVGESDLVAHNAAFDKAFCTKHPEGVSLANNAWIDSLDLARISLPRLRSHRLIDLVHAFDAPISTHRADADVEALCTIYRILLSAIAHMPEELVAEIANLAPVEEWPTVKVFQHFANPLASGFSLRSLRQNLVAELPSNDKVDAAEILGQPDGALEFPTADEIEAAFTAEGAAGAMYEDFEARFEQVEMARQIAAAFADAENLVVEAGTGVGKSLAYLVPSALTAKHNKITIGVATKTNALLDQLVSKELPLLASALGGLEYASLKGFSHYPCLRRIEHAIQGGARMVNVQGKDVSQAPSMAALLSFIEQSDFDDIDALKIDYRALPRYVITTSSNDCLRRRCPFYGTKCFVHGARQRAEAADIVVTNQSLLFCDVAAEGGLLPPIRYWVVDEAHNAEDEARRAFSVSLDAAEITALATRASSVEPARNMFTRAQRQLVGKVEAKEAEARTLLGDAAYEEEAQLGHSVGDTLALGLCTKATKHGTEFAQAADEFCKHIHDLLFFEEQGPGSRNYDRVDLWINDDVRSSYSFGNLASLARLMCDAAGRLIKVSQELVAFMENVPGVAAVQREIASSVLALKDILGACELILFNGPPTHAYAAHLVRKGQGIESLEAILLSVADTLNETLFANTYSVIFTSATITVANAFDAFTDALGLGQSEFAPVRTCQLDSSYDFNKNMTIYVVNDLPEPNASSYLPALEQLLCGVHRAQGGSVLTLFTNRREMEKAYDTVRAALSSEDLRIICQKWGVSTKGLRDEFLADESLSLFALKSFWEGFDAPGATLKTVVIPKLPFAKPSDPLSCERAKNDDRAWAHYVLPAAVLETKQAAGRLIRSSTDTGSLVLADVRLVSKNYGSTFLNSLPSNNIHILSSAEIVEALARSNAHIEASTDAPMDASIDAHTNAHTEGDSHA